MSQPAPQPVLRRALGAFQYMTIAVGCMIGIGWVTVLGEWLSRAGPLGAVGGFLIGGLVMAGVAACYAELTGMMPSSGGDVVFAERVFGRDAAFFVGWFLILMAVSVAAFEALSFVWVAGTLAPWLGATPLYTLLGQVVTAQQLALGLGVLAAIYAVNRLGVGASARAQDLLTVLKIAVMLVFFVVGLGFGDLHRLLQAPPVSAGGQGWAMGMLWIAATCAFWLGGFQVISQSAEERSARTSLRTIGLITTGSVAIGILFYVGVVVSATAAAPLTQIIRSPLPAAAAAEAVFQSRWGAAAVLAAGLAGILATLNAMLLSGSRLSLAVGRIGYLPRMFAGTDARGAPVAALTAVSGLAALGVVGGKGLLVPVVDMASMSLILSYVLVCAAVLRLRRIAPDAERPFRVPGGGVLLGLTGLATAAMAVFVVLEPALAGRGVPIEWTLFAAWAVLGVGLWLARRGVARRRALDLESALADPGARP